MENGQPGEHEADGSRAVDHYEVSQGDGAVLNTVDRAGEGLHEGGGLVGGCRG